MECMRAEGYGVLGDEEGRWRGSEDGLGLDGETGYGHEGHKT